MPHVSQSNDQYRQSWRFSRDFWSRTRGEPVGNQEARGALQFTSVLRRTVRSAIDSAMAGTDLVPASGEAE